MPPVASTTTSAPPVVSQEDLQKDGAITFGEEAEDTAEERPQWGSKIEFILTCVGYAVGLGNVWRFPYLCYRNGGGAFLIPYFLMMALVGMPIFLLELSLGQFCSLGPLACWTINRLIKGVGYAMVFTNTVIALYYSVIISWSIYYFFASCNTQLPWEYCGNWWNTDLCVETEAFQNLTGNESHVEIGGELIEREDLKTPSEEYYYNQVLRMSDGIENMGGIVWQLALCLFMVWIIVFFVLIKGISSLGKVVYVTSTFPYVMMTIMLIRGATLPGAATGVEYYLKPEWSKLLEAQVWSDAATQIFYSLSACTGGLIAMASFNPFENNVYSQSIAIPLINCLTSFYAGFAIFTVLGFMAEQKGVSVDDVADDGPGLVFVVYPEALTQMPGAWVWSILFFLMLISLGFSSEFSMAECFIAAFSDDFASVLRRSRTTQLVFRIITITCFYLLCLPQVTEGGFYLFNLVDIYIGGFPLLFIGLFETCAISYIYGYFKFAEDVNMMIGRKPSWFFKSCLVCISPLILGVVIIFMCVQWEPLWLEDYEYPQWANFIGWMIVFFVLLFIPVVFFYRYFKYGGWKVLVEGSKETSEWGPALPENRTGRYYIKDKEAEEQKKETQMEELMSKNRSIVLPRSNSYRGSSSNLSGSITYDYAYSPDPVKSIPNGHASPVDASPVVFSLPTENSPADYYSTIGEVRMAPPPGAQVMHGSTPPPEDGPAPIYRPMSAASTPERAATPEVRPVPVAVVPAPVVAAAATEKDDATTVEVHVDKEGKHSISVKQPSVKDETKPGSASGSNRSSASGGHDNYSLVADEKVTEF